MNYPSSFPEPRVLHELRELISAICETELTDPQRARLEELVCADSACAAYFASAMEAHAALVRRIGRRQATSAAKLIAEWQSRDNEFWNDVVKTASALEASVEQPRVQLEGRTMGNADRRSTARGIVPRAKTLARRFSEFTGIPSHTTWIAILCLTSATFALTLGWMLSGRGKQDHRSVAMSSESLPLYVARVLKIRQAEWPRGQQPLPSQSRLASGQRIYLSAGIVEISFDSGAVTAVEGPAEFIIRSSGEGFLQHGRVMANVPPAARGFAIQTEGLRVVDLGTRFGVDVDESQNASVHVLTGVVEAFLATTTAAAPPIRIEANRAVRYDSVAKNLGQVPVDRSRFEEIESTLARPVITEVRASSGQLYRVVPGGLQEDALAYIDRDYQWNGLTRNGLPPELVGAEYVMTSNGDDLDPEFQLQLTLAEPATVYVFLDDRAQPVPDWLAREFVDTGWDVGMDTRVNSSGLGFGPGESIDVRFSVWKRRAPAGEVVLGATDRKGVGHYGVAVVADADTQ